MQARVDGCIHLPRRELPVKLGAALCHALCFPNPAYQERLTHGLPADVTLERIPADKALEPMLAAGELDGLIHAHAPDPFRDGNPGLADLHRLDPDFIHVENHIRAVCGNQRLLG